VPNLGLNSNLFLSLVAMSDTSSSSDDDKHVTKLEPIKPEKKKKKKPKKSDLNAVGGGPGEFLASPKRGKKMAPERKVKDTVEAPADESGAKDEQPKKEGGEEEKKPEEIFAPIMYDDTPDSELTAEQIKDRDMYGEREITLFLFNQTNATSINLRNRSCT